MPTPPWRARRRNMPRRRALAAAALLPLLGAVQSPSTAALSGAPRVALHPAPRPGLAEGRTGEQGTEAQAAPAASGDDEDGTAWGAAATWSPTGPGVALGLAAGALLVLAAAVAVGVSWRQGCHMRSVPVHENTVAAIEHWIMRAKTQDLDFYTCMGLVSGLHQLGPKTRAMMPRAVLLFVMQGILPGLLVLYHMRDFHYYSPVQDLWFRLCAAILFCFSVVHMYCGAFDECRTMFLELALRHHVVSWWFLWPMLVGEVLNAFSAYTLVITLILVFCHVDNTPELLVHCLAINFIVGGVVVSIDNDIVDEDMRHFSISKLHQALAEGKSSHEQGDLQYCVLRITTTVCAVTRVVLTLCVGLGFSVIFFFAHQERWCQQLGPYSSWPFCEGLRA